MKVNFIIPLLIFSWSLNSYSAVKAQFFGVQTMLNIISAGDSDPLDLFNLMNVPIQNSIMGPGKAIVSLDKIFNFVCAVQGNENKCSIIIKASPKAHADPINQTLIYEREY